MLSLIISTKLHYGNNYVSAAKNCVDELFPANCHPIELSPYSAYKEQKSEASHVNMECADIKALDHQLDGFSEYVKPFQKVLSQN